MPLAAIGVGLGTAIAGAAAGGATIYGAHQQSSATRKASDIAAKGNADTIAFEREQAAEDKRRYDQQTAAERAQYEATEARRAPYRAASAMILSRRTGLPYEPYQPQPYQPPTFKTVGELARPSAAPPMVPTQGGGTIRALASRY